MLTCSDGASLIYTSNSVPNSLPTLVHSTLGIHSTLKKQALKHNVVDRDKALVPPNWDSWGKIRVLREGFDVEGTSNGWGIDIQRPLAPVADGNTDSNEANTAMQPTVDPHGEREGAVLSDYESTLPKPRTSQSTENTSSKIEVSAQSMQDFLAEQQESIFQLQAEDSQNPSTAKPSSQSKPDDRINEQIGPVQVNMGGIQFDADDVVQRLQMNREREGSGKSVEPATPDAASVMAGAKSPPEEKAQNEALNSFFANLIKRGTNSPRGTPGRDGKSGGSGRDTPTKRSEGK